MSLFSNVSTEDLDERNQQQSMSIDQNHGANAANMQPSSEESTSKFRVVVTMLLSIVLILIIIDSFGPQYTESSIVNFMGWVERNPRQGMLAFISVYIAATILFVPGSILTFGAGYAFGSAYDNKLNGVAVASTVVFIGASIGSICTFLLGRYLFRSCVLRLASSYPLFQAIDRALQSNGLKIMILLRLSPLIPYNALDYMSGITAIPLWAYSLALIGLLPGTISLCVIGASASSITDDSMSENKTLRRVTIVAGVVFAASGVFVASYFSKRELDRILAEDGASAELLGDHDATIQDDQTYSNDVPYSDDSDDVDVPHNVNGPGTLL